MAALVRSWVGTWMSATVGFRSPERGCSAGLVIWDRFKMKVDDDGKGKQTEIQDQHSLTEYGAPQHHCSLPYCIGMYSEDFLCNRLWSALRSYCGPTIHPCLVSQSEIPKCTLIRCASSVSQQPQTWRKAGFEDNWIFDSYACQYRSNFVLEEVGNLTS